MYPYKLYPHLPNSPTKTVTQGMIVVVFEKKGRGYWKKVRLGTIKSITSTGLVELFDGLKFQYDPKVTHFQGDEVDSRSKFRAHVRLPFAWETIQDIRSLQ